MDIFDSISLNLIEEVVRMAKTHGLESFKYGGLEFKMRPPPPVVTPLEQLVPKPDLSVGMPGDDQMLFYSTPMFEEK